MDVGGIITSTGEKVYCVTDDINGIKNSELITIQDNEANLTVIDEEKIALSVWAPNMYLIYIGGGNGLFKITNNKTEKINYNDNGYVGKIRGNGSNDFFITGGFGLAAHFNGMRWEVYDNVSLSAGNYNSVSMKGNMVVLVGDNYGKAVIALGRRD